MTGRDLLRALRLDLSTARTALRQALRSSAGDVSIAAAALGVSRSALYDIQAAKKIIQRHGVGRAEAGRRANPAKKT